jgi:hypothetical protein
MKHVLYPARSILKQILPEPHYSNLRRAVISTAHALNYRLVNVSRDTIFKGKPTYAYDNLMTINNADFTKDPRFIRAYASSESVHVNRWFLEHKSYWRLHVVLWAANRLKNVEGDFVECGVYRGASARAVVDYIDFGHLDKTFFLLDTYSGIEKKYLTDAERSAGFIDHNIYEQDYYDDVVKTFADFPNVKIVRGPVPDTLPQVNSEKIAYLSIDMNNVTPEIAAIDYLWDRLVSGAIIIHDDYGFPSYINSKRGLDELAVRKGVEVLCLPTGQGIILKP